MSAHSDGYNPAVLHELQQRLGPSARRGESLARHASARIGGPADLFVVAKSGDEMVKSVDAAETLNVPWRIIGSASNLLIADAGVEGLVIKAANNGVEVAPSPDGHGALVTAEAGAIYAAVGKQMALRGLGGLEWAVNVPGTVGASVVNNSGAFGSSTGEHLVEALVYVPGQGTQLIRARDLDLTYRSSRLKRGELLGVVLRATYQLVDEDPAALRARMQQVQRTRRTTQPSGYSVGSVFTNPPGDAAGRLVEAAGLKGHQIGAAAVSTLHANFILNRGAARAQDVLDLMRHIQHTVWCQTNAWLTPEVQMMGRWPASVLRDLEAPGGDTA